MPGKKVALGEGAFFGEMALLGNSMRGANVTTTKVTRLLVLDLVDFRLLMARHPDIAGNHRRRSQAARMQRTNSQTTNRMENKHARMQPTRQARRYPRSAARAPPSASTGRNI